MMLSAPATLLTAAVTLLAVLIALWTAILVARTRTRVKIPPPAVSGFVDCGILHAAEAQEIAVRATRSAVLVLMRPRFEIPVAYLSRCFRYECRGLADRHVI